MPLTNSSPLLSQEQALMVDCVRSCFGLTVPGHEYAPQWDLFRARAEQYGMTPVAHAGLAALDTSAPMEVRRNLSIASALTALRIEHQIVPAFHTAIAALQGAGLSPVVLKGMALAHQVYPRPALRTFSDIDILLPHQRIEQANRALTQAGFWIGESRSELPDHHHGPVVFSEAGSVAVELHHGIVPGGSPFAIDVDVMLARSQMESIAGVSVLVPSHVDMLLHVCTHLSYGHSFDFYPFRSLMDIFAMVSTWANELDWNDFISTAVRTRVSGAVYWPLRLSRVWFGAQVPDEVLARLAPAEPLKRMVAAVATPSRILDGKRDENLGNSVLEQLLLQLANRTGCSFGVQVRSVFSSLFPSTDSITHLPATVTNSKLRYMAALTSVGRFSRGASALVRLLAQARTQRWDLPALGPDEPGIDPLTRIPASAKRASHATDGSRGRLRS
ncbi:MAG: nucleotidyltransferase family protein [Chloroflexota bacterium]